MPQTVKAVEDAREGISLPRKEDEFYFRLNSLIN